MDQDIINLVCYGKIKHLDFRQPKFDDIDIYNEIPGGAFFVSEDYKKGVIDKDGKVILNPIYDEISYKIKGKEIFFIARAKNYEFKFNNKGDSLE